MGQAIIQRSCAEHRGVAGVNQLDSPAALKFGRAVSNAGTRMTMMRMEGPPSSRVGTCCSVYAGQESEEDRGNARPERQVTTATVADMGEGTRAARGLSVR